MDPKALELVVVETENSFGNKLHQYTSIRHRNHTGWIVDGKLQCRRSETEPFFECHLEYEDGIKCEYTNSADGHTHGPGCGHEMVPHGDHFDYIVGTRLHHVVGTQNRCCERGCLGDVVKSTVVDHGHINVRHRPCSSAACHSRTRLISEIVETDMYVAGICCQSELSLIYRILEKLPGVESVDVTFVTKNVHVKHDAQQTSPAVLLSALNGAGLQASLKKREIATDTTIEKFPFHVLLSGILLAVSIGSMFSSEVDWLKYVALFAFVIGCPQIVLRGLASLRRFVLDINILTLAACIGAIALGEYIEAGAIVFLFGLAQYLENRCMQKARNAITSLRELQPEFAISASTNEPIPVDQIAVDDELVIRPGDRVAVDGIIISGSSSLDESMLTGESRPVMKTEGHVVYSGSVNCGNGSLNIKSTSTVAKSTVALLSKKVEEAAVSKSKTNRIVENFAKYYTPAVVFAAILIGILPLVVESLHWRDWLMISLILLVSACPCAMVISTPVATICGISTAAHLSILIKGGEALEMLSKLKGLSFDKTGTLTRGHFSVVSITKLTTLSKDEILRLAAELETHSSHPLAAAIVGQAAAEGLCYQNSNINNVTTVPGGGLITRLDKINTAGIGKLQMLLDHGFHTDHMKEMKQMERKLGDQGKKACFVGENGSIVGVVILSDSIRDNATSALMTLTSMKLKLALLTGDDYSAAQHVANSVDIPSDRVHSRLLPEQKASVIRDLKSTIGPIGHVGDGVNDSVALAAADVGIAMGIGGSTMAVEAADVALFSNDLSSIPKAIHISQKVTGVIYQNLIFAIAIKVLVMILAVLGKVHLWGAVAADVGSSLLVVINSLRILSLLSKGRTKKSCCEKHTHHHVHERKAECKAIVKEVELQHHACHCSDHQCHSTV